MRRLSSFTLIASAALASACALNGPARAQGDVPYVPTPQPVVEGMLELANVGPEDFLIDLGSGDGRIPITAAKRHGARAMGIDLNPVRVAESEQNLRRSGVADRVSFENADLFEADLRPATVLTMYLLHSVNLRLRPKILEEMRPGSRVVSHDFTMGEWEPDRTEEVAGKRIYLWIVPAKVEGEWTLRSPEGGEPMVLNLEQQFQEIAGTVRLGERVVPILDPQLSGDSLSFVAEGRDGSLRHYEARIRGDLMLGAFAGDDGQPESWRAVRRSPEALARGAEERAPAGGQR